MKQNSIKQKSKTKWDELNNMSDEDIDFSEIPELNEDWFKKAKLRLPTTVSSISIKFDSDILDWLKSHGKQHQTQINTILRNYINSHA